MDIDPLREISNRKPKMAKLNQIIAIEKGIKSKSHSEISELYKLVQKPALFNGFSKSYQANDEENGEKLG